jgi:hypothetical protein
MSEYETPIDIMPSVRPSSGNLDKSHYMRRLILDNPNITAEEASAAFAFYDETVSRCTYNLVRAQIYGPKFTKRKSRKKRAAKVAAAPVELKPAPAKSNLEQSKPAAVQLIGIDAAPVLLGSARVIIARLIQLVQSRDMASLSDISSELHVLATKLAYQ